MIARLGNGLVDMVVRSNKDNVIAAAVTQSTDFGGIVDAADHVSLHTAVVDCSNHDKNQSSYH